MNFLKRVILMGVGRNRKLKKNKRADEEIWQLIKLIIAVVVLVLMIIVIMVLFKGQGGKILDSIKNLLRFGRS